MVRSLEKAIEQLSRLPNAQQESMAQWILDELEDDMRWDQAFAASASALEQMAMRALEDHRAGRTQPLNVDELE
jgi:hypothetical protein